MARATWTKVKNDVDTRLKEMVQRGRSSRAYIARVIFPRYQEYQLLRWQSEDQFSWHPLNERYRLYKLRKYYNYMGRGSKMMIATGELLQSVLVKPGHKGRVLFQERSMEISIDLPYAKFANEKRNFTKFSPLFIGQLKQDLATYLRGSK